MKILVIEPMKAPKVKVIEDELEAIQKVVGEDIDVIFPFAEDVALVYNGIGKMIGLPKNRALKDDDGQIYDVVCGTFFLCGAPLEDDLCSLPDELIEQFTKLYQYPESFS